MTLVEKVEESIKGQFLNDTSGHDWHHIKRVYNLALFIHQKEGGDREIIQLAALLHDISDHKFNGGKLDEGGKVAYQLLIKLGCDEERAQKVKYIVDNVSYKGADTKAEMNSKEGEIVQDADRLDAIGAIGIARTFAYGGNKNQAMYEPGREAVQHKDFEEYAAAKTNTINHFYEKLLLLKNRLNTATAVELGQKRHNYMEGFLKEFLQEWNFNESFK